MKKEVASPSQTIALLFPPFFFNDMRGPYLSLPHLLGFLGSRGVHDAGMLDVNRMLWSELTSPSFLTARLAETDRGLSGRRRDRELLHQRCVLSYLLEEPERLRSDRKAMRMLAGVIFGLYYERVDKSIPYQVAAAGRGEPAPLLEWVTEPAILALDEATRLVGITVPTADQLYPALTLARRTKQRFGPEVHVTLGGPIFSLLHRTQVADVLSCLDVDSVVLHEGETALLRLCEYVQGGCGLDRVPNLLYRGPGGELRATAIEPAPPLDCCPPPVFSETLLAGYASPVQLPVWATRGCYWGKCTFCDYVHLSSNNNHAETIRVQHLVDVIEELSRRHSTDHFELITECLSPSFCRRFAEEIATRSLKIRWTTHLKVEDKFSSPDLCRQIRASGCDRVTIGVESFNDRQLAIMEKGCTSGQIVAMLEALRTAGIRRTINIIVDFPSVTEPEAEQTLAALQLHRRSISGLNVFPFVLSRKTAIADDPDRFGISALPEEAVKHNRGFHFAEFRRIRGLSAEQCQAMLARYQYFSDRLERRNAAEESGEELAGAPLSELQLRPQRQLLFLRGEDILLVCEALDLDKPSQHAELVFDLQTKEVFTVPRGLAELHRRLPSRWTSVAAFRELIVLPDDADMFVRDLLFSGVYYGLFAIRTERLASESAFAGSLQRAELMNDPAARTQRVQV